MFKLVLHHTYKLAGEAIDISHNESHGFRTAVAFQPNGISPGSGTLRFSGGPSRVQVASKPLWQHPRAVKVEAWVKLRALGQRRNLVEGDLSFAFFVHPDGVLWGTFFDPGHRSPAMPGGDPSWPGVNSDAFYAPDHVKHTVPLNTWTKLTYLHDGISSLRLYINDKLVGGNYTLRSSVPSVGSAGVVIGHWPPADDRYTLDGEIDELKVWKYDPDAPLKQFYCRPMKPRQMQCWRELLGGIAAMLGDKEDSGRVIGLMRCLWSAEEGLVRTIRGKGEAAIKRSDQFNERYLKLWCAGDIAGPEMEKLMLDWQRWVLRLLGRQYLLNYRRHIEACWREYGGTAQFGPIAKRMAKCDPAFAGYYAILDDLWRPVLGL